MNTNIREGRAGVARAARRAAAIIAWAALAGSALAQAGDDGLVGRLLLEQVREQVAAGDDAGAKESCLTLMESSPASDAGRAATELLLRIFLRGGDPQGDGRAAIAGFLGAVRSRGIDAEYAEFHAAESQYRAGRFADARDRFLALGREHPASSRAPAAALGEALCAAGLDDPDAAEAASRRVAEAWPESPEASKALLVQGWLRLRQGDTAAARAAFGAAAERYPASPSGQRAAKLLAALAGAAP